MKAYAACSGQCWHVGPWGSLTGQSRWICEHQFQRQTLFQKMLKNCLFTFKLDIFINKLHYQVKCWLSNLLYTDLVFPKINKLKKEQVVPDVCPDSETQLCKDRMTFSLLWVLTLSSFFHWSFWWCLCFLLPSGEFLTSFRQRTTEDAVHTGHWVLSLGVPCRPPRPLLSLPAFAWTLGEGKGVAALRTSSSHDHFLGAGCSVHRQMSNGSSKAGSTKSKCS